MMVEFKIWLENNDVVSFLDGIKRSVLNSIKMEDGKVSFNFPSSESQPIALAANHKPKGNILYEGYGQQGKYGKGTLAFKAVQGQVFPDLDAQQADMFQKRMQQSPKVVGKEMGLLFELEVYLYLVEISNLQPRGERGPGWVRTQNAVQYETIKKKTSKTLADQLVMLIRHHAKELATSMLKRTQQMLKDCEVNYIVFSGGEFFKTYGTHRQTADMILGCSKKSVGHSLKFTSETMPTIAHLWNKQSYIMFGGKKIVTFSDKLKEYEEGSKEESKFVLDSLEGLIKKLVDKPVKLNYVINKLLLGAEETGEISNTVPAFRNYIRGKGEAGFAPAIRKNFRISYQDGNKILIKPNSEIGVRRTKSYINIYITAPDSNTPTIIKVEAKQGTIAVKMSGLI
ncbi:MAG: hypothetical protein HOI47_16465 [Candidatus Scalindua sp.]|jgi:hypothetical protein|nr:hypothetical protein [Candidatus Scalindua sp.]